MKSNLLKYCLPFVMLLVAACNNIHPKFEVVDYYNETYHFTHELDSMIADTIEEYPLQMAAFEHSFIGNYWQARRIWRKMFDKEADLNQNQIDVFNQKYKAVNAAEYILNGADKTDIFIINEAHHVPYGRVYTASLLQQLYDKGYRYLGLEAIINNQEKLEEINSRGYPFFEEGYYTNEPQMANLVREAIAIGYQIFGYEHSSGGVPSEREQGQAENIAAFIQENTDGKYLIHCGFAHAFEGNYGSWGKTMAGRLTDLTDINPFTVNQSDYFEDTNKAYYREFVQDDESVVYVDEQNKSWQKPDKEYFVDAVIFHERSHWETGRPKWYASNGRSFQNLTLTDLDIDCPCLAMAFFDHEDYQKAVPIDIVEIEGINTFELKSLSQTYTARMALAPGNYNLIVTNTKYESRLAKLQISAE